jgi:hypothetical protein
MGQDEARKLRVLGDAAPTSTGFAEIIRNDFPVSQFCRQFHWQFHFVGDRGATGAV